MLWQCDQFSVHALERVLKRRTIVLSKDIGTDLDSVLRGHAQHVSIEGSMVNRAHGHTIRHDRLAAVRVLLDVRGIQQRNMTQAAE